MPTILTDAAGARLRQMMLIAFDRALAKHPDVVHESFYLFGGRRTRIRIVGQELAKHLTRPFSHLRANNSDARSPQLTIDVWDETETHIHCQAIPSNGDASQTKFIAVSPDGCFLLQQRPGVLNCYNKETQHIMSSVMWGSQLSVYEQCKPFGRVLLEWHNQQDVQIIHAALMSRHGKGALFVGKSGSGKSTSSLACLAGGLSFLSEDFVGLEKLNDGSFIGHSIFNSVFLETNHVLRFPRLVPHSKVGLPHEDKLAIVLSEICPERLERAVPIQVLLLPRIVDAEKPAIRRASKSEVTSVVAESFLELPSQGLGKGGLERLLQLAERVPSYWLELGRDLELIPSCVDDLLERGNARCPG